MNPLIYLEVEKRARLVAQGVLPTTFSGVSFTYEGESGKKKREIPTFPHLFTPINQPFRRYQGLFGRFTHQGWGPYEHLDATDLNISFAIHFFKDDVLSMNEEKLISSLDIYHDAMNLCPNDPLSSGYCFFSHHEKIFYIKKIKEEYQLCKINEALYSAENQDFHQLVRNALSLHQVNLSAFYTVHQAYDLRSGGIFTKVFNETLTHATYGAAAHSLIKKMQDNLYQLVIAHPYFLGLALVNLKPSSFFYHVLGLFHALFSLVLDPLIELIALVTRTVFASTADEPNDLFPEAFIAAGEP